MTPAIESVSSIRELFERFHHVVVQAAYRITGRTEDAEDVLQTVFTRLLQREGVVEPVFGEGARAYLQRAAVNAALDIVKARRSSRRVPLELVGGTLHDAGAGQPDRLAGSRELADWLRGALSRLHPRSAEMFALRFLEGLSNQEIAGLLGTTPGTVAVTLHRVRVRLQEELADEFERN